MKIKTHYQSEKSPLLTSKLAVKTEISHKENADVGNFVSLQNPQDHQSHGGNLNIRI